MRPRAGLVRVGLLVLVAAFLATAATIWAAGRHAGRSQQITVPAEDRFTPFGLTIHPGDTVRWVNNDTDDHTVVSDDVFNTAGHQGTNRLLPAGGTVTLRFT